MNFLIAIKKVVPNIHSLNSEVLKGFVQDQNFNRDFDKDGLINYSGLFRTRIFGSKEKNLLQCQSIDNFYCESRKYSIYKRKSQHNIRVSDVSLK